MSTQDRTRWNARYADGAYATRDHPSVFLAENIDELPSGSALDLACGAGRNSRYLAERGWVVTAVDISDEGLTRVVQNSVDSKITTQQADLDDDFRPSGQFDVILILRYLNLELVRAATNWLKPGGMLLCEVLLAGTQESGVGPIEARFRTQPGDLTRAASALEPLHQFEGDITDPDGRTARVSQLLAVKR